MFNIRYKRPAPYLYLYLFLIILSFSLTPFCERISIGIIGEINETVNLTGPEGNAALLSALLFNSGLSKDRNNSYIPDIIERIEYSSNSYKVTLNRNVLFWDGTEVTSSIFREDLLNKKFFTSNEIQIQNRYTLSISPKNLQIYTYDFLCTKLVKMPEPTSQYIYLTDNFQGTGPFMIAEFNKDRIILIKNPKYFKGKPKIDEIELVFYKSYYDEFAALMRGEIDLIYFAGKSQVKWLCENPDFKIIDISFPFLITLRFNFNTAYPLSLEQRKYLRSLFSQEELENVFCDYYSKTSSRFFVFRL